MKTITIQRVAGNAKQEPMIRLSKSNGCGVEEAFLFLSEPDARLVAESFSKVIDGWVWAETFDLSTVSR